MTRKANVEAELLASCANRSVQTRKHLEAATCWDGRRAPLKEGLARTIAYFESLLQEEGERAVAGSKKRSSTCRASPF
jgi:hypothetical protein